MSKTAAQLRSEFLNYFEKQGHTRVEAASLIPQNDPTLLFTSAGMVQFKDVFLGTDPRPYTRAASSQKCLRAGGKHNDLENVGFTARHHTFFEMLGNFSFGDYFKKDAIHYAWEFITKNISLDKKLLYVTVYNDDDEAADIWHKQEGIPRDRIFRFGEKDNFWSMGDTGPCGPCSEIFFDKGMQYSNGDPNETVGSEGDRFMEIWNLVFMQYNRDASGKMTPLPKPSIDTGMGLERLASAVQGVATNYDTDLFQNLINRIGELAKVKYGKSEKSDVSLRVIADHCRATNFLISDGILPGNEGRGYVLRRIMRRAIRHGRNLGFREPFFYKLTTALIDLMGDAYPDIKSKKEFLQTTIQTEEERFLTTLDQGMRVLDEEMKTSKNKNIAGTTAFKLYDTFGFPFDLTEVIAKEQGFAVDEKGFTKAMEEQKTRSRENWKGSGQDAVDDVYKNLQQKGLKTNFQYSSLTHEGQVLAVLDGGKQLQIVVDETPFYAEGGGQAADRGTVTAKDFSAHVVDVKKPTGDYFLITLDQVKGSIKVGDRIAQNTDKTLRALTAKNHTATHLLHHALRKYLGLHVQQAGSLVNAELLRFDFTHTKPLTEQEIIQIEDYINEKILSADTVTAEEMDKDKAQTKGAIAFFGDKYGARVRVLSIGDAASDPYSVEFCGGTHVRNTADIMSFKILNENGIAAGVRRITAVTGPAIVKLLRDREQLIDKIMDKIKVTSVDEVLGKVEKIQASEKELKKALEDVSKKSAAGEVDLWIKNSATVQHGKLISAYVEVSEGESATKVLRDLSDLIRSKVQQTVIALGAKDKAKNQSVLLIAVTKDLLEKYHAGELVKKIAPILEGSGGGKPDLAQAGGKNFKFDEAFTSLKGLL